MILGVSMVCAALTAVLGQSESHGEVELRSQRYSHRNAAETRAWQESLRNEFFTLLKLDDLRAVDPPLPFDPEVTSFEDNGSYALRVMSIRSTPGRRMTIAVATPKHGEGPFPAVVALHGHGGTHRSAFDGKTRDNDRIYKEFGARLAERGYTVIAPNVGQHEVYEENRTLMGERLWDCMRCVDYLRSLPEVDGARIGCGGLSLGGEMAMWLGAMDPRVAATVSAGYLTMMDQMEQNHCMCWKFDGLRERVDWPDVYAMIAPRPLQCQNGLKEPETDFTVTLAREAMDQVRPAYEDLSAEENVELHVHDGAHEIDLGPLLAFFDRHLKAQR